MKVCGVCSRRQKILGTALLYLFSIAQPAKDVALAKIDSSLRMPCHATIRLQLHSSLHALPVYDVASATK